MLNSRFQGLLVAFLVVLALPATGEPREPKPLLELEASYVEAWRNNDESAVMKTISDDAVIIPSRLQPIRGADQIRAFWFPRDGSKTTITTYRTEVVDAKVEGAVGWLFGTGELSFTWEKDGTRVERSQESTFTMIARRGTDGQWRIVHRMWTDIAP